jgi:hypothetical protein
MGIIAAAVPLLVILLLLFDKWGTSLLPHPQFTIRDLMLSTALIAAGFGAYAAALRLEVVDDELALLPFLLLYLSSGPLIGAGVFLPFGRASLGAVLGSLVCLVMCCRLPLIT